MSEKESVVEVVAATLGGGKLYIVQIVKDDGHRVLDLTDEFVDAHLARALQGLPGCDSITWRRITAEDLPEDTSQRDKWRDNGSAIYISEEE